MLVERSAFILRSDQAAIIFFFRDSDGRRSYLRLFTSFEDAEPSVASLFHREVLICSYWFDGDGGAVLKLLERYSEMQMSFGGARLVAHYRFVNKPMLLTTDANFRILPPTWSAGYPLRAAVLAPVQPLEHVRGSQLRVH
jgi:hypothetical protein